MHGSHLEVQRRLVGAIDEVAPHEEGVARLAHVGKVRVADGQYEGGGLRLLICSHPDLLPVLDVEALHVHRPALHNHAFDVYLITAPGPGGGPVSSSYRLSTGYQKGEQ